MFMSARETSQHSWPQEIQRLVGSAPISDSSGCSGAVTWRIDGPVPRYLKIGPSGSLAQDAKGLQWFARGPFPLPRVLAYITAEQDYLLTSGVDGSPSYCPPWRDEPERLAALLGRSLRTFHDFFDPRSCPLHYHTADMLTRVKCNHAAGRSDAGMLNYMGAAADTAYDEIIASISLLRDDAVLHGDWCLPNVLLSGWQVSGLLDLGKAGRGDRHYDLHWGCWSLWYNLGSRQWAEAFLDGYGRDVIDPARLRLAGLIAAMDE